ncbi:MAG: hypothetical protein JST54_25170 [Deltaproteobacteria bacterium]|nr:hypothetical protein [Deltaproteobacteria bacterium]
MVAALVVLVLAGAPTQPGKRSPPPSIHLTQGRLGSSPSSRELIIVQKRDGSGKATYLYPHGLKLSPDDPKETKRLSAEQMKALWARLEKTSWWTLDGKHVNNSRSSHPLSYQYELSDGKRSATFSASDLPDPSMQSVDDAVLATTTDLGMTWKP